MGTTGIPLERAFAHSIKMMTARWIDYPLEVLWHGLAQTDWMVGAQADLTVALIDLMGWVDLARELGAAYAKGRPLPKGPPRTLWELKHGLDTARKRVEETVIMIHRLELSTLGHEHTTRGWHQIEERIGAQSAFVKKEAV